MHRKCDMYIYTDPTCRLLPPKSSSKLSTGLLTAIAASFATRFKVKIAGSRGALKTARIVEYGKVKRIDSEAGDTMRSCNLGKKTSDTRDATFVRVCFVSAHTSRFTSSLIHFCSIVPGLC
jgi:hypothetical protein